MSFETEIKEVLKDTMPENAPNITFRGFLLGNYTEETIHNSFPILSKLFFKVIDGTK